jgi:hypothetical protein
MARFWSKFPTLWIKADQEGLIPKD